MGWLLICIKITQNYYYHFCNFHMSVALQAHFRCQISSKSPILLIFEKYFWLSNFFFQFFCRFCNFCVSLCCLLSIHGVIWSYIIFPSFYWWYDDVSKIDSSQLSPKQSLWFVWMKCLLFACVFWMSFFWGQIMLNADGFYDSVL